MQDLVDQGRLLRGIKGRPKRQQLVKRDAQAVDIAPAVGPAVEPLRRHVPQGPDDVARRGLLAHGFRLGQAEVEDPDGTLVVHQQVRRLDVAVQNALIVRVTQRLGDLETDAGDPPMVLRLAPFRDRDAS